MVSKVAWQIGALLRSVALINQMQNAPRMRLTDPTSLLPTLWVGTSLGSVLTVAIQLPELDDRKTQPVLVTIAGECK